MAKCNFQIIQDALFSCLQVFFFFFRYVVMIHNDIDVTADYNVFCCSQQSAAQIESSFQFLIFNFLFAVLTIVLPQTGLVFELKQQSVRHIY